MAKTYSEQEWQREMSIGPSRATPTYQVGMDYTDPHYLVNAGGSDGHDAWMQSINWDHMPTGTTVKGKDKMGIIEDLERQAQELLDRAEREREKAKYVEDASERMGENDDWEIGSVVTFTKRFDASKTSYTYATVKTSDNMWAVTGMSRESRMTFGQLVRFIGTNVCERSDIRYYTTYKEI